MSEPAGSAAATASCLPACLDVALRSQEPDPPHDGVVALLYCLLLYSVALPEASLHTVSAPLVVDFVGSAIIGLMTLIEPGIALQNWGRIPEALESSARNPWGTSEAHADFAPETPSPFSVVGPDRA